MIKNDKNQSGESPLKKICQIQSKLNLNFRDLSLNKKKIKIDREN